MGLGQARYQVSVRNENRCSNEPGKAEPNGTPKTSAPAAAYRTNISQPAYARAGEPATPAARARWTARIATLQRHRRGLPRRRLPAWRVDRAGAGWPVSRGYLSIAPLGALAARSARHCASGDREHGSLGLKQPARLLAYRQEPKATHHPSVVESQPSIIVPFLTKAMHSAIMPAYVFSYCRHSAGLKGTTHDIRSLDQR
jgi:hypothetical protein